jgi:HEAT repeat protein
MPSIDVDGYRKTFEQQLKKSKPSTRTGGDLASQVAGHIGVASDREAPVADRLASLRALAGLEFLGPRFSPFRADYVAALRELATDSRATVRRSALESLALRKDPEGRTLLIRGLERPADALVSEAVALQYLGHDDHGDVVPLARKVYRRASGAARQEALRILATDPGSATLLKRLMADKEERSSIRRLSASALRDLDPDAFEKTARKIVADDGEFNEIRSTVLTALSQQAPDRPADLKLIERVKVLNKRTRSPAMRSSSALFLDAHDTS